jgi:hypothetical protein
VAPLLEKVKITRKLKSIEDEKRFYSLSRFAEKNNPQSAGYFGEFQILNDLNENYDRV